MRESRPQVFRPLRLLAFVLASWAIIADAGFAQDSDERRKRSGLVGIVGSWTVVDDGGPALQADGTKWSGTTAAAQARTLAQELFGSVSETFVSNATAAGAFPLAVWRDATSFSEGTLRVQFKLVSGESDQTAGLVFNLQPTGEYLFVRYNTKDGNLAVWRYAGGERSVLAHGTTKAQLPRGTWHEMSVTIAGRSVNGAIKATEGLSVAHSLEAPATGRVGLWTKRDSVTTFRQFSAVR